MLPSASGREKVVEAASDEELQGLEYVVVTPRHRDVFVDSEGGLAESDLLVLGQVFPKLRPHLSTSSGSSLEEFELLDPTTFYCKHSCQAGPDCKKHASNILGESSDLSLWSCDSPHHQPSEVPTLKGSYLSSNCGFDRCAFNDTINFPVDVCCEHMLSKSMLYCETCDQPVCFVCSLSKRHRGHDFDPLQDVAARRRWQISDSLSATKNDLKKRLVGTLDTAIAMQRKIQTQEALLKSKVDEQVDSIVLKLEDFRKMWRGQLSVAAGERSLCTPLATEH